MALPDVARRREQVLEQRRVAAHRDGHRRGAAVGLVVARELAARERDLLEVLLDAAAEARARHDRLVEVHEQPLKLLEPARRRGARRLARLLGRGGAAAARRAERELVGPRAHVLHHALVVVPRAVERLVARDHAVERDEQLQQVAERAVRDREARVLERRLVQLLARVVQRGELVHHVHAARVAALDEVRELLQERHEPPDRDLAARGRGAERVARRRAVVVVVVPAERLAEHGEPREEVRLGDLGELVDLVAQVRKDREHLAQELLARVDELERGHALGRVEVEAHGDRVVLARHLRRRVGDGELDAAQRRLVLLHEHELALQLLLDRPPRLLVALLILEEEGLRVRHRRGTRDATHPRLRWIQKIGSLAPNLENCAIA